MTDEQRLRAFLKETFPSYGDNVARTEDLSGVVDSLGMFDLLAFVEREFGVEVPTEEFHPQKFSTIDRILECVGELRSA